MKPGVAELRVDVREENLCQVEADCVVLGVFDDQRPLRGGAGLVDWRLCGRVSALLQRELIGPRWALLSSEGRLQAPRVLVGAIGATHSLDAAKLETFAYNAAERILDLKTRVLAWDLALAGSALTAEAAAAGVLQGFGRVLEGAQAPLELRLCAPEEEGLRWRVAVERAIARRPRGEAPLRLTAVTATAGGGAPRDPQVIRRAQ